MINLGTVHPDIDILEQPEFSLVSVHRPVEFIMSMNSDLFIVTGVKATLHLKITPLSHTPQDDFTIKGRTFKVVIAPAPPPEFAEDGESVFAKGDAKIQADQIEHRFRTSYEITNFYDIIRFADDEIKLVALKSGTDGNTDFSENSSGRISSLSEVAGVNSEKNINFTNIARLYIMEDGVWVQTAELFAHPVTSDNAPNGNTIIFRISGQLDSQVDSFLPDISSDIITSSTNPAKDFYLFYGQVYGKPQVTQFMATTEKFTAINGLWPHEEHIEKMGDFDPVTFGDGFRFLTDIGSFDYEFCKKSFYFLYAFTGDSEGLGSTVDVLGSITKGAVNIPVRHRQRTLTGASVIQFQANPYLTNEFCEVKTALFTAGTFGAFDTSDITDFVPSTELIHQAGFDHSPIPNQAGGSLQFQKIGDAASAVITHSAATRFALDCVNGKYKFRVWIQVASAVVNPAFVIGLNVKDGVSSVGVQVTNWTDTDGYNQWFMLEASYSGALIALAKLEIEVTDAKNNMLVYIDDIVIYLDEVIDCVDWQLDQNGGQSETESPENLFTDGTNGTMEDPFNAAEIGTSLIATRTSFVAHSGTYSINPTGMPGASEDMVYGTSGIALQIVKTYRCRAWVYVNLASLVTFDEPKLTIVPHNLSDAITLQVSTWGGDLGDLQQWVELVADITTVTDITGSIKVLMTTGDAAAAMQDNVYIDDLTVNEIVTVTSSTGLSETLRACLDKECCDFDQFVFHNHRTGFDTLITNPIREIQDQSDRSTYDLGDNTTPLKSGKRVMKVTSDNIYRVTTQHMSEEKFKWVEQFLNSNEVYFVEDGQLIPIIVNNKNTDVGKAYAKTFLEFTFVKAYEKATIKS